MSICAWRMDSYHLSRPTKEDTFIGAANILNFPAVKQAEKCHFGLGERLSITPTVEDIFIGAANIINFTPVKQAEKCQNRFSER
jgi:hypothetical protein